MVTISRCQLCSAPDYYFRIYHVPWPSNGLTPLDCDFLLRNYRHYRGLYLNHNKALSAHAKEQCKRILWVFEQYGVPKKMALEGLYDNNIQAFKVIINTAEQNKY